MNAANVTSISFKDMLAKGAAAQAGRRAAAAANEPLPVPVAAPPPAEPVYVRTRAPDWAVRALAMALGLAAFLGLWALVAKASGQLPDPASTFDAAVKVFGDPFYRKGPNDQGIGWNVLTSLGRVGLGFG